MQDFLVHLTCAEEPGKDNLAQEPARVPAAAGRLLQIQEIADEQYKRELIAQKGAGAKGPTWRGLLVRRQKSKALLTPAGSSFPRADVVIDPRASICFANIPAPTAETELCVPHLPTRNPSSAGRHPDQRPAACSTVFSTVCCTDRNPVYILLDHTGPSESFAACDRSLHQSVCELLLRSEFVVQAEEEYLQSTGRLGSLVMYLHAYPRAWVLAYSVRPTAPLPPPRAPPPPPRLQ